MARLDFLSDTANSYKFFWFHKKYLLQNAIPVIFIKMLCTLIVVQLHQDLNLFRQGLILLPSHAVEAFFLANVLRFAFYHEPVFIWGKFITPPAVNPEGNPIKYQYLNNRKTAIHITIIIYLLIKIIIGMMAGLLEYAEPLTKTAAINTPNLANALLSLTIMAVFFWSLRLFWIYVPAAFDYSILKYLRSINGGLSSFYFIGIFIISFFPPIILYTLFSYGLFSVIGNFAGAALVLDAALQSTFILIVIMVQALAVGFGCQKIMRQE